MGFGKAYAHYLFVPIRVFGNARLLRFLNRELACEAILVILKGNNNGVYEMMATMGGVYCDDGGLGQ